jgi:CRISPR/Cas system-associated protein Cas10 (large subunit of type III CRISPR-Cas system)
MEIKLRVIKENKDGSANAIVDFDKEGLEFLVQEGLLSVIQQYIEQNKNAKEGMKLRKKLSKKKEIDMDGRC